MNSSSSRSSWPLASSPAIGSPSSPASLDVDPGQGLIGECDFILAVGPALPPLHAPLMTVVEAKKNDVEAGLGQCIAQMVGAKRFDESAGRMTAPVFGCVTTGETWQFLQLADSVAPPGSISVLSG